MCSLKQSLYAQKGEVVFFHDSNMQSKVAIFAGVNGPTWLVQSYLVNF